MLCKSLLIRKLLLAVATSQGSISALLFSFIAAVFPGNVASETQVIEEVRGAMFALSPVGPFQPEPVSPVGMFVETI